MTDGQLAAVTDGGPVAPWRRLLARLVDGLWQGVAGVAAWYVVGHLGELDWRWALVAAAAAAASSQVAGESLLLWALATTPGKALAGLRVTAADGAPPGFRTAVLRALKVTTFGAGFWLGPLALGAAAATVWRLLRGRPLAWERGGEHTVVRVQPSGWRRQAAACLTSGCIALFASAGPLLLLSGATPTSTALSQDLRRSITGQWLWLHPFSGRTLTLDAGWRLVHESAMMEQGFYDVSFARSDDSAQQVRLSMNWVRGASGLCLDGEFDLQDAGFVVIRSGEPGTDGDARGECSVRGGRLDGNRIVYGEVHVLRTAGAVYKVFHSYADGSAAGRVASARMAAWLLAETRGIALEDNRLVRHYWRNDLTGELAALPGDWMLDERSISPDSVITYTFIRWPGGMGAPAAKDAVFLAGVPKRSSADVESAIRELVRRGGADGKLVRESSPTGEESYLVQGAKTAARITLRSGRSYVWVMAWANNESGAPPGSAGEHALLKHLLTTLR